MATRGARPKAKASPRRRSVRAGRPSREAAHQLREHILQVATQLLLAQGYGATSIEEVARQARVSKRTIYDRFADKPELMRAVVVHLIDSLRPAAEEPLIQGENLEQILVRLAALILRAALTPRALALHRLIVAESQRFPELASAIATAGGRQEAVALIGGLLMRHGAQGELKAPDAQFAAQQFLQMVVSLPQLRAIGFGSRMTAAELDAWAKRSVALFLRGIRKLSSA